MESRALNVQLRMFQQLNMICSIFFLSPNIHLIMKHKLNTVNYQRWLHIANYQSRLTGATVYGVLFIYGRKSIIQCFSSSVSFSSRSCKQINVILLILCIQQDGLFKICTTQIDWEIYLPPPPPSPLLTSRDGTVATSSDNELLGTGFISWYL